ncbi:NrfD/PsrC family molybdoenzyme membrane anchor subunit [Patulibacter sp. SYSU D01012]|uniref:NrfD/PsrC family molybdoenzyme membrane anchor subunit n=1 Tax=Patulibacter sp. SYSU D01012 TaxID=2817381 RepID=UPI001B316D12|nr:NrfD/PsrC family molybdoenzyme membrane anchor subunit [Patulibacter sp. SYSU D01012]
MSTVPPRDDADGPDDPADRPSGAELRATGGTRTGGTPLAGAGAAPMTGDAPGTGARAGEGAAAAVAAAHREIRPQQPARDRTRGRRRRGGGGGARGERQMVPDAEPRTYYGQQVVKTPVWTWEVPWYFFTGGLGGASAVLAGVARLGGEVRLAQSASAVSVVATAVSPVLLIMDLGRPARFLNMLRVFKITSPMSVGTWGLSILGGSTGVAALWQIVGFPPALLGVPSQAAATLSGPFVATYTAVLLTTTAVPVWSEARRTMPFVFAGSSLASAGGAATALTPVAGARAGRAMGVAGGVLEAAASAYMERRLDPRIAASYHHPTVRPLNLAAKACALGGATVLATAGRRSRTAAVAGGAALMAGSALERWAIFKAGRVSAEDPVQTVGPQRERADARAAASPDAVAY